MDIRSILRIVKGTSPAPHAEAGNQDSACREFNINAFNESIFFLPGNAGLSIFEQVREGEVQLNKMGTPWAHDFCVSFEEIFYQV